MVELDFIIKVHMIVRPMRTTDIDPDLEVKARIIADFRAAMAELRCLASERLVRVGVSMSQLHIMSMLDRHGDMPMSRLAEMIDVSLSNATGLVDRIEERGWVERVRVPDDRRVVLVRITAAGRRLLDDVEVLRSEILQTVVDRLAPDEIEGMARATAGLRAAITAVAAAPGTTDHDHTTDHWKR
jgi:DNA-binding MarR family transcriptional regulator